MHETVPPALAGERLDRVVAMFTGASRAEVTVLVADGLVRVNGEVAATRARRLEPGDQVDVTWEGAPAVPTLEGDPSIAVPVVYADDDVLVIDKPSGLVVHPGAGNLTGTLVHGLLAVYPELATVGEPHRPGIVHRLDLDTSGLMIVARTQVAYEALVEQLRARDVERRYLTLVWGTLEARAGLIDAPIGRSARAPTRMAVSSRGREARTTYEVVREFADPVEVSLLTCRLETGRTHQIRVHLAAIGHPVVGDTRYRGGRQSLPVPRMFLHAAGLRFTHPVTGRELTFESPLPPDLAGVLSQLS